MKQAVLLDTGPLLAAVLPRDPDHEKAMALLDRISDGEWRGAHTTDYVLAEAWNFIRTKVKRHDTAEALHALVFGHGDFPPIIDSIVRIHSGRFAQALARYRTDFDRVLPLTDWTSVVAMEDAGIAQLATFAPLRRVVQGVVDL